MTTTKSNINNTDDEVLYTIYHAPGVAIAVEKLISALIDAGNCSKYIPFRDEILNIYHLPKTDLNYYDEIILTLWGEKLPAKDKVVMLCKTFDPVSIATYLVLRLCAIEKSRLKDFAFTNKEIELIDIALKMLRNGNVEFYDARRVPELYCNDDGLIIEI